MFEKLDRKSMFDSPGKVLCTAIVRIFRAPIQIKLSIHCLVASEIALVVTTIKTWRMTRAAVILATSEVSSAIQIAVAWSGVSR